MADAAPPVAAPITIARIDTFILRVPISVSVRTSFGLMHERPALLVRLADTEGGEGWGEVWCNYPACGAEHRARLLESVFRPLLEGLKVAQPAAATATLERATRILAVQAGEAGPFAQVIAGIDCALWDLAARRAGQPLWRLLGGQGEPVVAAYASGINPERALDTIAAQRARGHRAFKVKVGFDAARDIATVAAARELLGAGPPLMADANQAWSVAEAAEICAAFAERQVAWIEEPLPADSPPRAWTALRKRISLPLAGGENLRGAKAFAAMTRAGLLDVVQPDCAKWGGVSGCLAVARAALAQGLRYCPHFLGAGVGLAHSAQILKAAGGDGLLEIDVNDNPLREELAPWSLTPAEGVVRLPDGPGIGPAPDPRLLARLRAAA